MKRLTQEEFISRASKKHPHFDYSETVFSGMAKDIEYVCPFHGVKRQRASVHLKSKYSCDECCFEHTGRYGGSVKISNSEFVDKAKQAHPDSSYEYKDEYTGAFNKISIICPTHGEFVQKAYSHLQGKGCPSCSGNSRYDANKFISISSNIHNKKFSYLIDDSKYVSMHDKVKIVCPMHGEFEQIAQSHIRGFGCSRCAALNRSWVVTPETRDNIGTFYIVKMEDSYNEYPPFLKVGITSVNLKSRFKGYEKRGFDISVVRIIDSTMGVCSAIESKILTSSFIKENRNMTFLKDRGLVGWTECLPLEYEESINSHIDSILIDGVY